VQKEVVYYIARTECSEVCLSDEHQACVWLPMREAVSRITFGNSRRVLRSAEKVLSPKT